MILKNCELWYPRLDPKKPNSKFNKAQPTWDIQLRTQSKEQKKEWEAAGLKIKAVVPDEGDPYFSVNLRKKSVKADGSNGAPPQVINGRKEDIDPTTIGNGSIGHVRIFQYEPPANEQGTKLVSVLMGLQITKHVVYVPKKIEDDFEEDETEVIMPEGSDEDPDDFQREIVQTKVEKRSEDFQKPQQTKPKPKAAEEPEAVPFDDPIPDMSGKKTPAPSPSMKKSDKEAEDDVF